MKKFKAEPILFLAENGEKYSTKEFAQAASMEFEVRRIVRVLYKEMDKEEINNKTKMLLALYLKGYIYFNWANISIKLNLGTPNES